MAVGERDRGPPAGRRQLADGAVLLESAPQRRSAKRERPVVAAVVRLAQLEQQLHRSAAAVRDRHRRLVKGLPRAVLVGPRERHRRPRQRVLLDQDRPRGKQGGNHRNK